MASADLHLLRPPARGADGPGAVLEPGVRVGRWVLRARLGAGSFGETWRAVRDDGLVGALKLLAGPPGDEVRVLGQLCHPCVPMLLDHGGQRPGFVVSALVSGAPLRLGARWSADDAGRLCAALLDALAYVHQAGHAHGDIKPDNVLVNDDLSEIALIDFGLANGQGGTLAWAAPERLRGEPARAPADVYAVGLLLYALLHGGLPFEERGVAEAAAHRELELPPITAGPAHLRALCAALLDPDPARRPTADRAADRLADEGVPLPRLDEGLLRRRARVVRIARPEIDAGLEHWVERGGPLLLVGPRGSGRSAALRAAGLELRAQGRAVLRLAPGEGPWGAVVPGLAELGMTLPDGPDPWTRAQRLARQLVADGVAVLVDDVQGLDVESTRVVEQLVAQRGPVLAAAGGSTPGFRTELRLSPLDGDRLGQLAERMVGLGADQPAVRRALWEASRGMPGAAMAFLIGAVEVGALRRRGRALLWDPSLVPQITLGADAARAPQALHPQARQVGALLALCAAGLPVGALPALTGLPDAAVDSAVDALVAAGLARFVDGRALAEPGVGAQLEVAPAERAALRCALLTHLDADPTAPLDLSVELALALSDHPRLARDGAAAVLVRLARDPFGAEQLSAALWAASPGPALAVARLRALVAAGRSVDALTFGEAALQREEPPPEQEGAPDPTLDAMVELASLCARQLGQTRLAADWIGRARARVGARQAPAALDLVDAGVRLQSGDPAGADALAAPSSGAPLAPTASADEVDLLLRARVLHAQARHALGDLPGALDLLSTLPAELGRGRAARAMLDGSRGRLLWVAGRYAEADAAMVAAGENDAGLAVVDRARLLNNLGALRYQSGDRAGAVLVWEQARNLFEQLDARLELVRVQSNLCVGYRELGRWERARDVGERALNGARELEAADLECNAQINLGALDLSRGRLLEAEERFLAAQQLAERSGGRAMAAEARLRRAEIATLREQPDAAALAAQAEAEAAALGMGVEAALAAALLAVGRARAQAPVDEVDACARRALDPLQASGASGDLAQARLWVAEAMLAAHEHQRARALLDKVRVYAREQADVQLALRADALDARISAHWSDPDRDARLEKMISLAVAINEATALDATLNQIARAGLDLVGGERAFVLLGQPPELMASALTEGASGGPSTSVVAQAMRDRKEVIAADVDERADLRARQSVVSLELRSVLCVPLLHRDEALGALYVDSRTASQRHLWNCALVMRGLAALAAVAVVRARMHQESVRQAQEAVRQAERLRAAAELHEKNAALQQLNEQLRLAAITDTLTGLYNRRHLAEVLAPLHWEATGRGEAYGVLLLDIDHFKRVNDTWGHPAGDLVIQNVAGIVLATVREEDLAFRYGGEELLVVVRGADLEALVALGERLRLAVRARPFEVCPGERHPVTVSVGAAVVHPGGDLEWDSVLQRADNALYAAKRGGRDQVVGHTFGEEGAAAG